MNLREKISLSDIQIWCLEPTLANSSKNEGIYASVIFKHKSTGLDYRGKYETKR